MKFKRFLVLLIITIICFSLVGCGNNNNSNSSFSTPKFQINEQTNVWEISYDNGNTWVSLGTKATGEKGDTGSSGQNGTNGVTPKLKVNADTNMWEVSYDKGTTWSSLGVKASTAVTYIPVIFKDYDGTVLNTQYVEKGGTITYEGQTPVRERDVNGTEIVDYTFKDWGESLENITSPKTFTAKYNSVTYTGYKVTFKDHDDSVLYTGYFKKGTTVKYPNANPYSYDATNVYIFKNWDTSLENISQNLEVKAEVITVPRTKNGEYPQSLVINTTTIEELNKINEVDDKGYKTYEGEKYFAYNNTKEYTDNRGETISKGNHYYKVEPIRWIYVSKGGVDYFVSDYVLDAQSYSNYQSGAISKTDYKGESGVAYMSNYKYSSIRTWLNTTFINTAFADSSLLKEVTVANGPASINTSENYVNEYTCEDTMDKAFILSVQDLCGGLSNATRKAYVTDYVRARGWEWDVGNYVTRSPYQGETHPYAVGMGGNFICNYNCAYYHGILPGIGVDLTSL